MVDSWREVAVSVEQLREFGFFLAKIVAGIIRDLSKTKGLCEKPRHNRGELLQGSKKTGPLSGENMWVARATLTRLQVSRHLEQEMSGK
jgi:hypothetical protein